MFLSTSLNPRTWYQPILLPSLWLRDHDLCNDDALGLWGLMLLDKVVEVVSTGEFVNAMPGSGGGSGAMREFSELDEGEEDELTSEVKDPTNRFRLNSSSAAS